jgi:phosphatidylserine/phosphatidylglycerophosphate/cardiolipin synthase-like enzyme
MDLSYLDNKHIFGRFLFKAVEEKTKVVILTRPSVRSDLGVFEALAAAHVTCGFLEELHSKVYLFDVDLGALNRFQRGIRRAAVLGSANMTEKGWGLTSTLRNEEICYKLPDSEYKPVRRYVERLRIRSRELSALRLSLARGDNPFGGGGK